MPSYVPKCAKETSDLYFRFYQQNSFTLPLFVDSLAIIAYQESIIASFEDIRQSKLSQSVDRR